VGWNWSFNKEDLCLYKRKWNQWNLIPKIPFYIISSFSILKVVLKFQSALLLFIVKFTFLDNILYNIRTYRSTFHLLMIIWCWSFLCTQSSVTLFLAQWNDNRGYCLDILDVNKWWKFRKAETVDSYVDYLLI